MMKRFFAVFLLALFVISAYAAPDQSVYDLPADTDPVYTGPIGSDSLTPILPGDPGYVQPTYNWYDEEAGQWFDVPAAFSGASGVTLQLPENAFISTYATQEIEVYSTVDPITSADATGLKALVLDLIGDYESIVTEYRYQNTNGTWSYMREITPDYVWLVSAAIFAIVLWCTFRAGVSICKR